MSHLVISGCKVHHFLCYQATGCIGVIDLTNAPPRPIPSSYICQGSWSVILRIWLFVVWGHCITAKMIFLVRLNEAKDMYQTLEWSIGLFDFLFYMYSLWTLITVSINHTLSPIFLDEAFVRLNDFAYFIA